jgi:glucosamine-6-phosphate deaminase
MKRIWVDKLEVQVYRDRADLGRAAAEAVSGKMGELLGARASGEDGLGKSGVNMVFAAAPSQNEFLSALAGMEVEWGRVNAFHMDEYIGLGSDAPQGFGNFLRDRLFSRVRFGAVHYMNGLATDIHSECRRYGGLLEAYPTDIVVLGIGENTHLAFNDPHVARFDDAEIGMAPTHAMTMTIPALMRARYVYVVAPGRRKAEAVQHTLYAEIGERYPSTILRQHPQATLFIDEESAVMI